MAIVNVELLTHVNAFGAYVDALGVRVNQTNADIASDARYINDATLRAYDAQVHAELLSLQGFVDRFNTGKADYPRTF